MRSRNTDGTGAGVFGHNLPVMNPCLAVIDWAISGIIADFMIRWVAEDKVKVDSRGGGITQGSLGGVDYLCDENDFCVLKTIRKIFLHPVVNMSETIMCRSEKRIEIPRFLYQFLICTVMRPLRRHSLLLLVLIATSCTVKSTVEGTIDVSNPQPAVLEDLAVDIRVIPIREDSSFLLGNVRDLKSYDPVLFLHDDGHRQIHCINDDGCRMFTLDAIGRAEHEYLGFDTFTFNFSRLTLDIFQRTTREIKSYQVPGGNYVSSHGLDFYVNAMDWLEESCYLLIREKNENANATILVYDISSDKIVNELPLRDDQAELMTDMSISKMGNGKETYVCVPGFENIVYRADSTGFTPVMTIRLAPNKLGEKYWSGEFNDSKERELLKAIQGGEGGIAIAPSFFVKTEKSVSFYYVTGLGVFGHNLPVMNLCLLRGGETWVVDLLTLQGTKTGLAPIGLHDGRYVALVETALVDYSGKLGEAAREIKELQADGIEHVLVEYGF